MPAAIAEEPPVQVLDPNNIHDRTGFNSMVEKMESALKGVGQQPSPDPAADKAAAEAKAKTDAEAATKAGQTRDEEGKWTSPKAGDWKKIKDERDSWKTKAETADTELKAKLAEIEALKKQPQFDPKELDTLKAERDNLLTQFETVALERSPKFSAYFTKAFDEATKSAKDAAGADYAEQVEHLMKLPPSKARKDQLAQIVGSLDNELDKTALTIAIRDMDRARAERDDALSKSSENWKKLQEAEKAASAAQIKKQEEQQAAATESAINEVMKVADQYEEFKTLEGDENKEHNAEVNKRRDFIKAFFQRKLERGDYALTPIKAARADRLEKVNAKMSEELKAAKETIAKLTASGPALSGHGEPKGDTGKQPGFVETFFQNYQGK